MRCLIIGGDGMLGHQLLESWRSHHDVRVTLRQPLPEYRSFGLFTPENAYGGVDVTQPERVLEVMAEFRPEVVVNAAGVIKQRAEAADIGRMYEINADFPHRLLGMCRAHRARLIHISTDCVFNGKKGGYSESDPIDAEDEYGRSKARGEVSASPGLTLRSSIIGQELSRKHALIEWFLAQRGTVKGYTRAIYTGLTTLEMARVIDRVLHQHRDLCGIWQVTSQPINKFELLCRLSRYLGRTDITIEPQTTFHCDRSLNGSAFADRTGYRAPEWDDMLRELAQQIQQKGKVQRAA